MNEIFNQKVKIEKNMQRFTVLMMSSKLFFVFFVYLLLIKKY